MFLSGLPDKLMLWICTKKRYGVWVLYCFDETQDEQFFSMCESALSLLFQSDPKRYQRIRSFVQNIVLTPLGTDCFDRNTRSILINDYDRNRRDLLAMSFVHESTHAYLHSKGLRYEDNPRRHEEICLKEEYRSITRIVSASPAFTDEQRVETLVQWRDYFTNCMKSEWWMADKQDLVRVEALRNLHNRIIA